MKIYFYAAILLGLIGSHLWMYSSGKDSERQKAVKTALEYREKENKLLAQLEEAKKKRAIVYRERIVKVDKIIDDCLDRPLPSDVKRLRNDASSRLP
jgi:hypothetical protein